MAMRTFFHSVRPAVTCARYDDNNRARHLLHEITYLTCAAPRVARADLELGEKSLVVLVEFGVVPAQHVDLHLHLVVLCLVAGLQAVRLVAQARLEVRHVRTQLVDRPLTVLPAHTHTHTHTTLITVCLLYTSPSPRDRQKSRMPSSA